MDASEVRDRVKRFVASNTTALAWFVVGFALGAWLI